MEKLTERETITPQRNAVAIEAENPKVSMLGVRRATGPRTEKGKQRSRNNALSHGIFSKTVVLPGESQTDFDDLLAGYRDHFQPKGAFEDSLVETLVVNRWRWRRFLIAESAEIQSAAKFIEWDYKNRDLAEAGRIQQVFCNGGLIRRIANKEALNRCLELLNELKTAVNNDGFNAKIDGPILTVLYGELDPKHWEQNLFNRYSLWAKLANACEEYELGSRDEYKKNFIQELNDEIKRLERHERKQTAVESARMELERLRHNVPDSPKLDALLRYATSLEREFDRTLTQLDRAQRTRYGQLVPAPIQVNLSHS